MDDAIVPKTARTYEHEGLRLDVLEDERHNPWFVAKQVAVALNLPGSGPSTDERLRKWLGKKVSRTSQFCGGFTKGTAVLSICDVGVVCINSGSRSRVGLYRWVMEDVFPDFVARQKPLPPRPMTADEMLADSNTLIAALEALRKERNRCFKPQVLGSMTFTVNAIGEGDGLKLEVSNGQQAR